MRFTLMILFAFAVTVRADDKDELKKLEGAWESLRWKGEDRRFRCVRNRRS